MGKQKGVAQHERGAALLTVLLLVAVLAVLAAHGIDRLMAATRLASNARDLGQARAYLVAAENIALRSAGDIVGASPGRTTNAAGWNGREVRYPVTGGSIAASLSDGGNCFNLNSVVLQEQAIFYPRPIGQRQFVALMTMLQIPPADAETISASLTDWIDSDGQPEPNGAEDAHYLAREEPYRTASGPITDISELRAIKGVTDAHYTRLKPWVCALPTSDLSPINVNTLRPEQGVLLAMLAGQAGNISAARAFLAQRPQSGYASVNAFWTLPYTAAMNAPPEVQEQIQMNTRWFALNVAVTVGGAQAQEAGLIDAQLTPARLVRRQWGDGW
jgi:general secretion pathway protein K